MTARAFSYSGPATTLLPQEDKAERALAKKRQLEEDRKKRIFDPKFRTIGVDKNALDEQVAEKERIKALEQDRETMLDTMRVGLDQHATYLQSEVDKAKTQKQIQVEQYRQTYQKKDMRREWDLNDPRRVIDDIPARIGDDDPRCGPSSLQQFHGEDLASRDRRRLQAEQQKRWAQQQVDERDAKRWLDAEQEREYLERAEEARLRGQAVEDLVAAQRRMQNQATADFNKNLAEARRKDEAAAKERETVQNIQEILHTVESQLMTEDPSQGIHAFDSSRHRKDFFKGMSPAQQQAILEEQAAQREVLRRKKQQEAEEEAVWASQTEQQRRLAEKLEAQRRRERAAAAQEVMAFQRAQAVEHGQQMSEDKELYRGQVTNQFLDNFNTNSR